MRDRAPGAPRRKVRSHPGPTLRGRVRFGGTPTIAEFTEPRLVAIYDTINAYEADAQPGFYAGLAAELVVSAIVDLGCGTGLITRDLARRGYRLTGVEPSAAMIDVARRGPDAERVRWIHGEARVLEPQHADLAIMTGHVAQFFVTDESWHEALVALHRSLRPGGNLAFETRNPLAKEWERWHRGTGWWADDPTAGRIETWTEVQDITDGIVSCTNHYVFEVTGDELLSPTRLRFRTMDELAASLAAAGFGVERVYGDWDRRAAGPTTRELIVIATR